MDPVSEYFESKGITPETAYFGESNYEVGKTVNTEEWTMTYRVEENEVIIGDFETHEKSPKGIKSSVSAFVELLKSFKQLPGIEKVKGMVLSKQCFPWEEEERKKLELLKKIYLQNGAVEELDGEGDVWVVY
ncbi:hypothetical protein SOPP22_04305 [Shewanella sp. OPT22]|nr:hypothetical protein SOPP22_04305 [Shewanella sp. OPT22]